MQRLKLGNIIFGEESSPLPETLYVYSKGDSTRTQRAITLAQGEDYRFTTYFNSCSCTKWRTYTCVEDISLHLRLKGKGTIVFEAVDFPQDEIWQAHLDRVLYEPEGKATVRSVGEIGFDNEGFGSIEFRFPVDEAFLYGFSIKTASECQLEDSYFFSEVKSSAIRPISLSIAMTTFRNEKFILPNIQLFKEQLLADPDMAGKISIHVVDNGRTLNSEEVASENIYVHPNPNVGGSGGFARGMIESLHQENKPTHVLLMDDDVMVSPESFKRVVALLSVVKPEHRKSLVSGAMLKLEEPNIQFEDIAWVGDGKYYRLKPDTDVTKLDEVAWSEATPPIRDNMYAAWWFCCIPVPVIEEKGLPLPLFVRMDDVEYGVRCGQHVISMNGICVWHSAFGGRFKASVDLYQYTRNLFIAIATTMPEQHDAAIADYWNNVRLALKKFDYIGADLLLTAFEDYMRGPDYISTVKGEQRIKENGALNEKLLPLAQLGYGNLSPEDVKMDEDEMDERSRSLHAKLFDYVTFSGHRVPSIFLKREPAIIPAGGFYFPATRMHRRKSFIAIDPEGELASLRKMDKKRFRQLSKRYKEDMKRYKEIREGLMAEYAQAFPKLTSEEFWLTYLEDQSK